MGQELLLCQFVVAAICSSARLQAVLVVWTVAQGSISWVEKGRVEKAKLLGDAKNQPVAVSLTCRCLVGLSANLVCRDIQISWS